MKITKSDKTLYVIVGLTLTLTLFANILISLIDMTFTWQTLASATFWVNIALTQILTLIPYFACITIGKNQSEKADDVIALVKDVENDFKKIDETFLSNDLEDTIEIQNLVYRCDGRITDLNKLMQKSKCTPEQRKQYVKEKDICIKWKNYYKSLNTLAEPLPKPTEDYDINEIKVNCLYINARHFRTIIKHHKSREVAVYNENEIVAEDSTQKVLISLIISCVFAVVGEGLITGGLHGLYNVVWRTFLIGFNAFMGFNEGVKLIKVFKYSAFKEKKEILNNFFNKMFILGKLAKKE